jgi:hypothetical protein
MKIRIRKTTSQGEEVVEGELILFHYEEGSCEVAKGSLPDTVKACGVLAILVEQKGVGMVPWVSTPVLRVDEQPGGWHVKTMRSILSVEQLPEEEKLQPMRRASGIIPILRLDKQV